MFFPAIALISLINAILFTISSAAPIEATISKRGAGVPKLVGAPVLIGPGTYPRANKLSDGSFLAAYTAFEGGNNIIRIAISTNNGQSWYVLCYQLLKYQTNVQKELSR